MSLTQLWLLTTAIPNLGMLFTAAAICSAGALLFAFIAFSTEESEYAREKIKPLSIALVLCSICSAVIPSERQLYVIAGGYVVTNNAEVQKLPNGVLKAANAWLERLESAAKESKERK